jgi:formate dehydrogenase subunit delta
MTPEKMVMMANQIAIFFTSQPGDDQAQNVANHINDFWEPRMRNQLIDHMAVGGEGLKPLVLAAAPWIKAPREGATAGRS